MTFKIEDVATPIILMISLKNSPASTSALLLNFEAVSISIIAAIAFKEALGKRVWTSVAFITIASIILTWDAKGDWGFSVGAAGVIIAGYDCWCSFHTPGKTYSRTQICTLIKWALILSHFVGVRV